MKLRLGDLTQVLAGYGFPEHLQGKPHGRYPFFKVGDISRAWQDGRKFLTNAEHYLDDRELRELRARPVPAQATVFAKIGAAVALNRRAMLTAPSLIDNNCFAVVPNPQRIDRLFLFYFLCGVDLGKRTRATTVPSLRKGDVEEIDVPSFGLPEQHRIVAAIETHFSRLDAAVAALTRAKANVKRARASVLKAAVEGRLVPTEAALARAEGRAYEPASVLLERIIAERKAAWAASGKRGKYVEPVRPEPSGLPGVPGGWCWASLEQLGQGGRPFSYGVLVPGPDVPAGVPFVRVGDIGDGRVADEPEKSIERAVADQFKRTYLTGGEVLLSIVGTIGRVGIASPRLRGANVARAVGVLPINPSASAAFVVISILSGPMQRRLVGAAHEVARKTLNMEDVRAAPLPLPPLAEQQRIVAEVDRRLSVLDALDQSIDLNLARCARLRQAVLKRAFEGRLVPAESPDVR